MISREKSGEVGLKSPHPFFQKWTRHEVVLKNQGKISIPLDGLLNPDGLFVSSYPKAHKKMVKNAPPINIGRIASAHTFVKMERSLDYAKRQCGRSLAESLKVYGGTSLLERVLRSDKAPSGFCIPDTFADHLTWHIEQSQKNESGNSADA